MLLQRIPIFLLLVTVWSVECGTRSFTVDYDNDTFLKDGEPFQFVSGSVHYFRGLYTKWSDRLNKLRSSGANVVSTYVEWSIHQPEQNLTVFDGQADIEQFLRLCQQHGLLVILRPGPFIDAERDFGGFPYWLLSKNQTMKLRTSDPSYTQEVEKWYQILMTKIRPFLYSNGGPVIMVQIENEYGSFPACDKTYTGWLYNVTKKFLVDDVIFHTTDGTSSQMLECGKVDGALSTIDFGASVNVTQAFALLRKHQPKGPLMNSEFYPGWLDHWREVHHTVDTVQYVKALEDMLKVGGNVNMYVFYGGTSFGFTAGSNLGLGNAGFQACTTSYDYDAPLDEAGDPTKKFYAIKAMVEKYLGPSQVPVPAKEPKMKSKDKMELTYLGNIFQLIKQIKDQAIPSTGNPLTFAKLNQANGFAWFTANVTFDPKNSNLTAQVVHDRGYVFVNHVFQGILDRESKVMSIKINATQEDEIGILMENQGRICFGSQIGEAKGIFNVTLGGEQLNSWYNLRIDSNSLLDTYTLGADPDDTYTPGVPSFFGSMFRMNEVFNEKVKRDTYLLMNNWSRGLVAVDGFNLGRYWNKVGPQLTLYVPRDVIQEFNYNRIILLELEQAPDDRHITFLDHAILDGPIH